MNSGLDSFIGTGASLSAKPLTTLTALSLNIYPTLHVKIQERRQFNIPGLLLLVCNVTFAAELCLESLSGLCRAHQGDDKKGA